MRILLVLTPRDDAQQTFSKMIKPGEWDLRLSVLEKLPVELKKLEKNSVVYAQVPEDPEEQKKLIKSLGKNQDLIWGLWDPTGFMKDPALGFFAGAFDYLGPQVESLTPARFQKALDWAGPVEQEKVLTEGFWESVQEEHEYEFTMVLVLIGETDQLKRKIGESRFAGFLHDWKSLWDTLAAEHGGRMWMDISTAVLYLFPPGHDQSGAFSFALRQLVNRHLYCFENLHIEQGLDIKIALHRGTALYRRPGQTGTVVSDAVNSVFHLGQKFTPPNTICFTAALLEDVPKKLLELTLSTGEYEGRQIYRLARVYN